jgi:hypothetical protein
VGAFVFLGGLTVREISGFSAIQFDSFGADTVIDFNILTHRAGRLS